MILGLSVSLVLLAALTLALPSWIINSRTVAAGLRRFGGAYRPSWRELGIEISSPGLLKKRVVLHAVDFCFHDPGGFVSGCLPELELDATLELGRSPWIKVRRLERLALRSRNLRVDAAAAPAARRRRSSPAGVPDLAGLVPGPLRGMTIGALDVQLPETRVVSGRSAATVSFDCGFSALSARPLEIRADGVLRRGRGVRRGYRARMIIDSDLLGGGSLTYLDARLRLGGDGGVKGEAWARLKQSGKSGLLESVRAEVRAPGRFLRARLEGSLTPGLHDFKGDLALEDQAAAWRRVELRDCVLRLPTKPGSASPRRAELACGLSLVPALLAGLRDSAPRLLEGTLTAQADLHPERAGDAFAGRAELSIGAPRRWYRFLARLALTVNGRLGRLPQDLQARYELESGLRVERFSDVVEFLEHTPYAVFAPLNSFEGPLSLEARSAGDVRAKDLEARFRFDSRLASRRQRLDARVVGSLAALGWRTSRRSWRGEGEAELKSVALELPYLKIGAIPGVSVDERIKTGAPEPGVRASTGTPLEYRLRVFSSSAAILYSNLAQDPVPVDLDLIVRPAGAAGTIRVAAFGMKIFGQAARIDHLKLTLSPEKRDMGLEGKVVCQRQSATIDIFLSGRTGRPQLSLRSDPPMTQEEIVGLLLFGKTPTELDGEQQSSVGNASAAMRSGAFGLASLYLFAATPIESVGYDTATQSYRVRFKLPGGASLSLGSSLDESRTLTLRKRLLRDVEVETELRRSPDQKEAVTTFLQWFRRY
ncbi:MAG TPA: hypothetical protein DEB40_13105 [Elusimicrobia bacterium]|nr:hypothetical protein [Elusimicrobiota bacterium]HBT62673.1 hypothetical protein [Elusimicrobiota bacterium]